MQFFFAGGLSMTKKWLTDKQVAELTGIKLQTLRNWRHQGLGPRYDKPSPRIVRYKLEEIQRFMESK
jgi:predicted DNA-binding transcriptional regulator AlpA